MLASIFSKALFHTMILKCGGHHGYYKYPHQTGMKSRNEPYPLRTLANTYSNASL